MVWLLRHQVRWLVDVLIELCVLPPGPHMIELLPNETWPVGEENRSREIRADVVVRLWPSRVPEESSLKMIRASRVIGLILDFQERRERDKELRVLEYDSAYPPVLGPQIHMVVLTLHDPVARWMRQVFSRKQLSMQTCALTPRQIPRSAPIDADVVPRRALLEAMLHARREADLPLLVNALRALRHFEGYELRIYKEMLMNRMNEALIIRAEEELDLERARDEDYKDEDLDDPLTEEELECFMYKTGERAGRATAVIEILRLRGIEVSAAMEARILSCRDNARVQAWLARAMVVSRANELLDSV